MTSYCSECWCEITEALARLGSLRCQDCRDGLSRATGLRSRSALARRVEVARPVAHENPTAFRAAM